MLDGPTAKNTGRIAYHQPRPPQPLVAGCKLAECSTSSKLSYSYSESDSDTDSNSDRDKRDEEEQGEKNTESAKKREEAYGRKVEDLTRASIMLSTTRVGIRINGMVFDSRIGVLVYVL